MTIFFFSLNQLKQNLQEKAKPTTTGGGGLKVSVLIVATSSGISYWHQNVSGTGTSSCWCNWPSWCNGGSCVCWCTTISGGFDCDISWVGAGGSRFIGSDGGSESTFVGDVIYYSGVAFEIVYCVGSGDTTGPISRFLVAAATSILGGGVVTEGVRDWDVLDLKRRIF